MPLLPRTAFSGRLCRLKSDESIEQTAQRAAALTGSKLEIQAIEGTKWHALWLHSHHALTSNASLVPESDGSFVYPLLLRAVDDRVLLLAKEGPIVNLVFENGGVARLIESPRIQVDRFTRDLVSPSKVSENCPAGRKYLIGSIHAAVEGYGRSLRSLSFVGDDLAEAELFRKSLGEITVTRVGIRDPKNDKNLLSISTVGETDFWFRGATHLKAIDQLTSYMRSNGYIEWREGASWQPEMGQLPARHTGNDQSS